uniref:integumentary mucin C.1-like n=1 Tax=Bombus vancouverensis nearcticus TaxID=2705178 RepID=UPI00143CBA60|nr:integumentary mucin C.1-like [Bombus vancouverensis nearcticus]
MRWFLSRTAALVQPLFHESRCDEGGKLCMIQAWRSLHCDWRRCSSVDEIPTRTTTAAAAAAAAVTTTTTTTTSTTTTTTTTRTSTRTTA